MFKTGRFLRAVSLIFRASSKGLSMNMQRNEWMTGIGILNIAVGAIGSLMSYFSMSKGGMPMPMGLVTILACVGLMAGGLGVLQKLSWGRMASMACGGAIALMNLYSLVSAPFEFMTVVFMLYGGLLVGLFCMPEWKSAFSASSSSASHSSSHSSSSSDDMRKAA